ncbi:MAG: hypothetical protein QG635_1807 [Bacteroidota bacterium]|nr:hypothetical protein [Bacteroidota bacterium]
MQDCGSSAIQFSYNNIIDFLLGGTGEANDPIVFTEPDAGWRGMRLKLGESDNKLHIGIGMDISEARFAVKGLSNTQYTNSFEVYNSAWNKVFLVRDDKKVGIMNNTPADILHVGTYITASNIGIGFNCYYDETATPDPLFKCINTARASSYIGTIDDGINFFIDQGLADGGEVFSGGWEDYKGIRISSTGDIGIAEYFPNDKDARLFIRGETDDDSKYALKITNNSYDPLLFVRNDGNVGIGVEEPLAKLVVDGTICAKEVRVSLSGSPCWSDFVFDKDYKLLDLNVLEIQIKKLGHLPGIPSAKEVRENGVELGEMQAKLLQKVEELTLYMIELKKENDTLKKEIKKLKSR